ncbi:MAG TPA: ABC transporter substrate-binding protein [Bradyrhizobium sp.]|nr:ABC transporter substrate-binding protein [Bradyrhizobium sp.]
MRRRKFITLIGGAAAFPLAVRAQQAAKMLRVGTASTQPRSSSLWKAFEQRMAELGYHEGTNYTFDYLNVPKAEEYEAGFRKLAARDVDIMVASGPEISLKSALASSDTKPIVMVAVDYDPLALGYVTSLARPTGNVTGLFLQQIELMAKRLQLLKSAFPDTRALTVFWDRTCLDQWKAVEREAAKLGLRLEGIDLGDPPFDYDKTLARAKSEYRGTIFVLASGFFLRDRERLADFSLRNRLVSVFCFREIVDAGGLLSYGPSFPVMYRRAAEYVDRIARGAKPADLPIEQPTKFDLVINLKTAKTLGLAIPPFLLATADEVIE